MAKGAKLVIKITGDDRAYRKELDSVERQTKKTINILDKQGKKLTRQTKEESKKRIRISKSESDARIRNAKRVAVVLAALAVAGIAASVIEFAKFEQGLAGVSKTTNIVGKELEDLGEEITDLSIKLGTSTGELLELAKSAGQLGVKGSKNIVKFTEVMAGLAKTTNIAGEEGAIALARLIKVTDGSIDNVDRLGSVIVDLGNNTAALENEILFTAQQIGGAGKVFGITATKALGLAAAFAELAIPPELARGTILRAFGKIQKAISEAGVDMEKLILITGLTGEELEKTFAEDSVKVFGLFLKGVARLPKSQLIPFLKDFELAGLRLESTLPKLALGSNLVAEKVERAATAFDENTASADELAIQLDTTQTRFKQLKAEVAKATREIGEEFIPVTESSIKLLKQLAPFIKNIVVPSVVFLTDKLTDLVQGFNILNIEIKKFLGIPIEGKFEDMRDLIKEESGLQKGLDGLIQKFQKLAAIEKEIFTKVVVATEGDEGEIFGPTIDTDEAEQIRAANEEIAEARAEAREAEKEALAEEAAAKLEIEQIERERLENVQAEDLARDLKAISDKEVRDKKAVKKEIAEREKAEKLLTKLKQDRVRKEIEFDKIIVDSALDSLIQIVGDNKAAQIALFLAKKAVAIQTILVLGQQAAALAIATVPPPLGESIAAERIAASRISAAIVAVTALPELIGKVRSGKDGGQVPGGFGGGDSVLTLLEPGEIITPERLNPLSPNFEETFGGGGQEITVNIELSEEASQFITVGQREDKTLGVQR